MRHVLVLAEVSMEFNSVPYTRVGGRDFLEAQRTSVLGLHEE